MKKIVSIQLLLIALLAVTSSLSFAQDRFGGLTLYTLRNQMNANPEETLQEVADAGYLYIEAADYRDGKFYGMSPGEFKKHVTDLGMKPLSAHMGSVTRENADEQIADVLAAGFKFFVIPVPPMGHFKFDGATRTMGMSGQIEEVAEILNYLGKECKDANLQLLYHNHDFEYKKDSAGIVPIDFLMQNTDPDLVNFQMDIYWVTKAGADPVAYMEKYPGRYKIWHVKDMDDQGRFAPVGTGTIDFTRILKEEKVSGMEYYVVEQDMTFDGMTPLEAIKLSHEGLKKLGFD